MGWTSIYQLFPQYINSVWVCLKMLCTPLYPMVLLIIIPMKNGYFIGNIPYFQTNPHVGIIISRTFKVTKHDIYSYHILHNHIICHFFEWKFGKKGGKRWKIPSQDGGCIANFARSDGETWWNICWDNNHIIWLVVWNHGMDYDFPFSWEFHHPNWLEHIFQRGRSTTNHLFFWGRSFGGNLGNWGFTGEMLGWTMQKRGAQHGTTMGCGKMELNQGITFFDGLHIKKQWSIQVGKSLVYQQNPWAKPLGDLEISGGWCAMEGAWAHLCSLSPKLALAVHDLYIRQKTSSYIPWMFMISPTSPTRSWSKLPKTSQNYIKPYQTIWVWVNTYRYIFSGMNIGTKFSGIDTYGYKSQLFWGFTFGTRVPWPIPISNHIKPMSAFQTYHPSQSMVAASFPEKRGQMASGTA